jgi:aminoglycoside phosphotransferase (APT) family kinase protein
MSAIAETTPVLPQHKFDETALAKYLSARLPDYAGALNVRQFRSGQSNPTFLLEADTRNGGRKRYVLRKKPPGALLPSAHQVDREYRVISALARTDVPVPRTYALCADPGVIGQMFYVMDCVEGRIFTDLKLPGIIQAERAAIFDSMNDVLARLHRVDVDAVGLGDYGRHSQYIARQIARWTKQYEAAKTTDIPAMNKLMAWLPQHVPAYDPTTIVHGDFRLGNLIVHPTEPRIVAVLDWELSTTGHPLADLAYNCLFYHLREPPHGLGPADLAALGIPSEAAYVAAYCRRTGRDRVEDWNFYLAFSLFRLAAIAQGVYKRGLDGNASSPEALKRGDSARIMSEQAWALAAG